MNALVREIVKLSEHSFRRGYQHGHAAGSGEFGPPPSGKQVHDWRFARNADFAAVAGPHEKRRAYRRWPAIDRVRAEINMTEYPQLFALLSNVGQQAERTRRVSSSLADLVGVILFS